MSGRALTFTVGCLLLAVAALLYLEWWRAGELEVLNGRVADLEQYRRTRDQKPARRPSSSSSSQKRTEE